MDAIAGLLDGPRARRAFLLRCTMDPPWALHIRDEAPLTLVAVLRGHACFVLDGRKPEWLDRGDVASRADDLGSVGFASDRRSGALSSESNVVDLCAFRATRTGSKRAAYPTSAASRAAGP